MKRASILPRAFQDSRRRLESLGINLWGVARLEDFDLALCRGAKVGERNGSARSVIVIGAGGSAMWRRLKDDPTVDPTKPGAVDVWSRRVLEREAETLRCAGYDVHTLYPFDPDPTCFVQMAEAAGIAVMSPVVNLLLHPRYGPWVNLRGALVVEQQLPSDGELDFDPCSECSAPCLEACPVDTYPEPGRVEAERCASHVHAGGCGSGCHVRRACPCGTDERIDVEEELARRKSALPSLRRVFGLGVWRFVPGVIRRRLFAS